MIVELFLTVFMYAVLILAVCIVAVVLSLCFPKGRKKSKNLCMLLLCLAFEIAGLIILSCRPVLICPEEYRAYVTEEDRNEIIGYNSGLYSLNIPFVPLCIVVKSADDEEILVETRYFPFGHTEMAVNDDGPDPRRGIFGVN